ncbi:MAG: hypothetical protein ACREP3_09850 [Candidatus Binatia bacterium]
MKTVATSFAINYRGDLEWGASVTVSNRRQLYCAFELLRLTVDLMLAEPFPRFEKLTATIAFKRQSSGFQMSCRIVVHRATSSRFFSSPEQLGTKQLRRTAATGVPEGLIS